VIRPTYEELEQAVREAGVLLVCADPAGDLPDQEAANLWSNGATEWLIRWEELITTPPVPHDA
jgi:hypothetical protein